MIKKGQRVWIKPEWCDSPEENEYEYVATSDEHGGRIDIVATKSKLKIPPVNTVKLNMLDLTKTHKLNESNDHQRQISTRKASPWYKDYVKEIPHYCAVTGLDQPKVTEEGGKVIWTFSDSYDKNAVDAHLKDMFFEAEVSGDSGGGGTNIASGENSGAVVLGVSDEPADKKKKKIITRKMSFSEWIKIGE